MKMNHVTNRAKRVYRKNNGFVNFKKLKAVFFISYKRDQYVNYIYIFSVCIYTDLYECHFFDERGDETG